MNWNSKDHAQSQQHTYKHCKEQNAMPKKTVFASSFVCLSGPTFLLHIHLHTKYNAHDIRRLCVYHIHFSEHHV